MIFVNIVLVAHLFGRPRQPDVAIPICPRIGAGVGAINGLLITRLRYPPVLATLGTFFVLWGVDLELLAQPARHHGWTNSPRGSVGPIPGRDPHGRRAATALARASTHALRRRSSYARRRRRPAFSAGVNVELRADRRLRIRRPVRGTRRPRADRAGPVGRCAVSTDTRCPRSPPWRSAAPTSQAVAAALRVARGAARIFLLENLLTTLQASAYAIQFVYGGVLLVAVLFGAKLFNRRCAQQRERADVDRRAATSPPSSGAARPATRSLGDPCARSPVLQIAALARAVRGLGRHDQRFCTLQMDLLDAGARLLSWHRRCGTDVADPDWRDRPSVPSVISGANLICTLLSGESLALRPRPSCS